MYKEGEVIFKLCRTILSVIPGGSKKKRAACLNHHYADNFSYFYTKICIQLP